MKESENQIKNILDKEIEIMIKTERFYRIRLKEAIDIIENFMGKNDTSFWYLDSPETWLARWGKIIKDKINE